MGTAVMMERTTEMSPRLKARITGVFYLLTMLTGIFGGLGWLSFMYPPLGYRLLPYIAILGLLGAVLLVLWLLVFGVNEQRWMEQASAAGNWRS
jgi:hypothetical protein